MSKKQSVKQVIITGDWKKENGVVRLVEIAKVNSDASYQRKTSENFISLVVSAFCLALFDYPLIGKRKDGTLWVIDGQTRHWVCKRLGWTHYYARVIESTGSEHEAGLFKAVNQGRRSMKPPEIFKASFKAGQASTVDIQQMLDKFQLVVGNNKFQVKAISVLYDAYKIGKLMDLLILVDKCGWKAEDKTFTKVFLGGLFLLIKTNPNLDPEIAKKQWRDTTPADVWSIARSMKKCKSVQDAVCHTLRVYYENESTKKVVNVQHNTVL